MAINIMVARMLGVELFGQYAIIQSTLLTVAFVAQLATGSTAAKYVAELRSSDPIRAGRVVGLCALTTLATAAIGAVLLALYADWLARVAMHEASLGFALRLGAAFIIFNCLNFYQVGALAGLESYPTLAYTGIQGGLVAFSLSIIGTWLYGLNGAIASLAVAAMMRWIICQYALERELSRCGIVTTYRGSWKERAILWNFSIPAALSGFLTMPGTWLANLFLIQQPNGFAQNALYNAALTLKAAAMFLTNNANSVGMSILSNQKGLNDSKRYLKLYIANLLICLVMMLVIGCVVIAASPLIFRLYGPTF
ncbi:MAG: oligosaccharide flippase family protein, partial [Bacteroidota bacterium]